jgi:hypothetical protein
MIRIDHMRRMILLCLFALISVSAANDACAQRRGGAGFGFAQRRGGSGSGFAHRRFGFSRARAASSYGLGYPYLPYDSGDAYGDAYAEAPQPALSDQRPVFVQPPAPPAPPVAGATGQAVILEYKWPATGAASSPSSHSTTSESEPQAFAIVLKDGSTLSAVTVFASADGLHYVDPDERHLLIALSAIDRPATLKLNRERNLDLHLPAAQ